MSFSVDPVSESTSAEVDPIEVHQLNGEGLPDEQPARRINAVLRQLIPTSSPAGSINRPVSADMSDRPVESAAASAGIRPSPMDAEELDALKKNLERELKDLDRVQKNLEAKAVEETRLGNPARGNYLMQISRLVADISTMLNTWTNRDSRRTEKTKKEYRDNSTKMEDSSYSKAMTQIFGGLCGVVVILGASVIGQADASVVSSLIESAKGAWLSKLEADATKPNQTNNMLIQDLQKLGESSGSNNDLAEKARRVLDEVKQWLEKAIARG